MFNFRIKGRHRNHLSRREIMDHVSRVVRITKVTGLLILTVFVQNCTPVFSDFQSAHTAGKGNVHYTPSYSAVLRSDPNSFDDDPTTQKIQNNYAMRVDMGVHERVDAQFGFALIQPDESIEVQPGVGFGPKVAFIPGKLAFSISVATLLEEGNWWHIQPALITTAPITEQINLNQSLKYIHTFDKDWDNFLAVNLGAGFAISRYHSIIRPEAGILFSESGSNSTIIWSIGLGITVNISSVNGISLD